MYTQDAILLPCGSCFAQRAHMHIWFAQTALMHFGLHKHECFIGVQSGLAYTQVIRTYKPNMCMHTYC